MRICMAVALPPEAHYGTEYRDTVNTLIIYCHPPGDSHSRRILNVVRRGLDRGGMAYDVVDLYTMGFDPLLKTAERERILDSGASADKEDVRILQAKVAGARNLIFVYPVWWYTMPAGLKGFLDRVFTAGFAYRFRPYSPWLTAVGTVASFVPGLRYLIQPYAVRGRLKDKRAYIFRTYGGAELGRRLFGNTTTALENVVLRFCGITHITIHELYGVNLPTDTPAREEQYLERVDRIVAGIRNA